jgi:hypothetical protein
MNAVFDFSDLMMICYLSEKLLTPNSELRTCFPDVFHPLTESFFKSNPVLIRRTCQNDFSFRTLWKLSPDPLMGEEEGDDKA